MQTGVKKRQELHEKYQEKFKELGVSLLYAIYSCFCRIALV